MNVKSFLQSIRSEQTEIEIMQAEKYDIVSVPGMRYDTDKVQTSNQNDLSSVAVKLAKFDKKYEKRINDLVERKNSAMRLISGLEDSAQRIVLIVYYLDRKKIPGSRYTRPYTWFEVAQILNYSTDHVKHLHGYALQNLQKNLECKTA
jgi:DNA-directed RNA polymerase specialized sigma subunit